MFSIVYFFLTITSVMGRNPPLVSIPDQGMIVGREVTISRTQKSACFLGIPFAAAPVRNLRFAPPKTRPLPTWNNTWDGTNFQNACIQNETHWYETHPLFEVLGIKQPTISEDCLYLNVFLPEWPLQSNEGLPVMVWIHPGNFIAGAASVWDGTYLASKNKVIVVTISYRLSGFGFLTMKSELQTNLGLLDQLAALEWVQEKIDAFGGNNELVTIFGQGAGAVSVGLHILSGQATRHFRRAIAMGGNALMSGALLPQQLLIQHSNSLNVIYGCGNIKLVECLKEQASEELINEMSKMEPWGPVVDRNLVNESQAPYLSDSPTKLFEDDHFSKVDLMIGYNDMNALTKKKLVNELGQDLSLDAFKQYIQDYLLDEELTAIENNDSCVLSNQHVVETVLFYYTPQPPTRDPIILRQKIIDFMTEMRYASSALKTAEYFMSSYVYRFDYRAKKLGLVEWTKVTDQFELPFIWGMPFWANLTNVTWSSNDKKFSETVMSLWTNFAKTGNASISGVRWDKYSMDSPYILKLDKNFNISDTSTLDYKGFQFWTQYFPQVLVALQDCCNSTSSAPSSRTVNKFNYLFTYLVLSTSLLTLIEWGCYIHSDKNTLTNQFKN